MKIFDFLDKIAIFGEFLFRSRDSRQALLPGSSVGLGQYRMTQISRFKEFVFKNRPINFDFI